MKKSSLVIIAATLALSSLTACGKKANNDIVTDAPVAIETNMQETSQTDSSAVENIVAVKRDDGYSDFYKDGVTEKLSYEDMCTYSGLTTELADANVEANIKAFIESQEDIDSSEVEKYVKASMDNYQSTKEDGSIKFSYNNDLVVSVVVVLPSGGVATNINASSM